MLNEPLSLSDCQVLFIADSMISQAKDYLIKAQGLPILSIGETMGFCQSGGVMEFVRKKQKLRFSLNLYQAKKAELKFKAKFIKVAANVITE